jgi:retinol dehydrogenase-12
MTRYVFAERFDGAGVTVNALHPGLAGTGVVDAMIAPFMKPFAKRIKASMPPPEEAAASIVRLATDPALDHVTGLFLDRESECPTPPVSYDKNRRSRVWHLSVGASGTVEGVAGQGFLKKK